MVIKYKISKELLVLQAITSFIPTGVLIFCIMNVNLNSPILYFIFGWLLVLVLFVGCISLYFIFHRLWTKDFLYVQQDRLYFYDCLRAKYIDVKIADMVGVNDYNLPVYPYSTLIIYTVYGRIFTCPGLTEEGKDYISEKIYEIIYNTREER